jgi:hypothetical protein
MALDMNLLVMSCYYSKSKGLCERCNKRGLDCRCKSCWAGYTLWNFYLDDPMLKDTVS